jgi:hypothetical protein
MPVAMPEMVSGSQMREEKSGVKLPPGKKHGNSNATLVRVNQYDTKGILPLSGTVTAPALRRLLLRSQRMPIGSIGTIS